MVSLQPGNLCDGVSMPTLESKPHCLPLVSTVTQWAGHKSTCLQNYPNPSLLAPTGAFVATRISVSSRYRAPHTRSKSLLHDQRNAGQLMQCTYLMQKRNNSNNQTNNAVKYEDKFIPEYNCTWHYTLECTLPCNHFSVHPSLLSL